MARRAPRILVLGAGGRLGRLLVAGWPVEAQATFQSRRPLPHPSAILSDPLADALAGDATAAHLAQGHDVILSLAGVTPATAEGRLEDNVRLGLAAVALARQAGVPRVLLASSAAVYGPGDALAEGDTPAPVSDYGRAKLRMERAVLAGAGPGPEVCLLRIGNVAGADSLLGATGTAPLAIDRMPDGGGPLRSYIGPRMLARVLVRLARADDLPDLLNLALPGLLRLEALAAAARRPWRFRPAPAGAIAAVGLDVTRLCRLVPDLPEATADSVAADLAGLQGSAP